MGLDDVVRQVVPLSTGGTLAVHLGNHALARGYRATIFSCNIQLFDPTWFGEGEDLGARLGDQARLKDDERLREATLAHLRFLEAGGVVRFGEITPETVDGYLGRGIPLLTGLSATYLYGRRIPTVHTPGEAARHVC
jgi:hypothetical protein